eukprot:285141-Prymnesium_polylepis.1
MGVRAPFPQPVADELRQRRASELRLQRRLTADRQHAQRRQVAVSHHQPRRAQCVERHATKVELPRMRTCRTSRGAVGPSASSRPVSCASCEQSPSSSRTVRIAAG